MNLLQRKLVDATLGDFVAATQGASVGVWIVELGAVALVVALVGIARRAWRRRRAARAPEAPTAPPMDLEAGVTCIHRYDQHALGECYPCWKSRRYPGPEFPTSDDELLIGRIVHVVDEGPYRWNGVYWEAFDEPEAPEPPAPPLVCSRCGLEGHDVPLRGPRGHNCRVAIKIVPGPFEPWTDNHAATADGLCCLAHRLQKLETGRSLPDMTPPEPTSFGPRDPPDAA